MALASSTAAAQPDARFRHEPSVGALQLAAARLAEVQPERVRSWMKRVRLAAALPAVKARLGHGNYGLSSLRADSLGLNGNSTESWRVEVELDWQLDRLVFNHDELALARESQRIAARRELLQTEVAQLYFARRRLQLDALQPADADAQTERQLAIDELTAVLDGLTDGALTRGTIR
jgi:hypothetical protein